MIEGEKQTVEGNDHVVWFLEEWLATAKRGKLAYVALIACTSPTEVATGSAGLGGLQFAVNYGCDLLKRGIMKELDNKMPEAYDPNATADRVMYNVSKMPCSFDFVPWLLCAEQERIRENAPAPLKVAWFWGRDGNIDACLNTDQRRQNFFGIMRPVLDLIGAIEDPASVTGRSPSLISMAPVVQAHKDGLELPKFFIPEEPKTKLRAEFLGSLGRMPVTITLREAEHTPHRNSNLDEWLKLAKWLEERGEKVIFVRDTAKADEPLPGFRTCPEASKTLHMRALLYSVAKANLFVSNGPMVFAYMGDRPWLVFNSIDDRGLYHANTSQGWREFTGIEAGGQFPWSRPDQRLIWANDKFEVMRDAWLEHIEQRKERAA